VVDSIVEAIDCILTGTFENASRNWRLRVFLNYIQVINSRFSICLVDDQS
jgi:hypothetical protein